MSTLEEKNAQLEKDKRRLRQLAVLNTVIDEKYKARDESRARQQAMRRARGADGRWQSRESPQDPSPQVSDHENPDPPGTPSSNESSVDPWEVAPHKRPAAIPPKPARKHPEDEVEVVQDLSDREDDGSTQGQTSSAAQSADRGQRRSQRRRGSERKVGGKDGQSAGVAEGQGESSERN